MKELKKNRKNVLKVGGKCYNVKKQQQQKLKKFILTRNMRYKFHGSNVEKEKKIKKNI